MLVLNVIGINKYRPPTQVNFLSAVNLAKKDSTIHFRVISVHDKQGYPLAVQDIY